MAYSSQIITRDFAAFCSEPYMPYIAHAVTGVWCGEVSICDARVCVCVLFVSSRSDIVLNTNASAITDHSQSEKEIYDTYFKSQLIVEGPGHLKPVLILPNALSKPGQRAHDRNFNFCRGRDSNPKPLDRQSSVLPLSHHRSVNLNRSTFPAAYFFKQFLNITFVREICLIL